jgi:threonine/homoserine/homoserine lactone efflux protein
LPCCRDLLRATAAFALATFVLIVIPGPSVLFVIGRALANGREVRG